MNYEYHIKEDVENMKTKNFDVEYYENVIASIHKDLAEDIKQLRIDQRETYKDHSYYCDYRIEINETISLVSTKASAFYICLMNAYKHAETPEQRKQVEEIEKKYNNFDIFNYPTYINFEHFGNEDEEEEEDEENEEEDEE